MKLFNIHKEKKMTALSWNAGEGSGAYAYLKMTNDGLVVLREGYQAVYSDLPVSKVAAIRLTAEDLDALGNAALVMADDIRARDAKRQKYKEGSR